MYGKVFLKPYCEPSQPASLPLFQPQQVQGGRVDGYWIEAFPFEAQTTKCANLIGYGLGFKGTNSPVQMFKNPYKGGTTGSSMWMPVVLAELEFPVAMHYADLTGNGFNDVIISDKYGPSMDDIWPDGGRVNWLENTGDPDRANWTLRTIGRSPGMHRLKAGHFTRDDRWQICAVPIVVKSSDLTTPAPVIIFTSPEDPRTHTGDWPSETVHEAHLVHEVVVVPATETGLRYDQVLLAGRDGVNLLWYNGTKWETFNVGKGLPKTPGDPYWGAGSAAVARVGSDYAGYIPTTDAFHGSTVSVYLKPKGSKPGITGNHWTRKVLDEYGGLNSKHTGCIHQVVCADIDGDGDDEFLCAMMGSDPPNFDRTGVWCYKMIDKEKGTFTKTKLSNVSAGRIATGELMPSEGMSFATISYSVPGYFESPNPSINVYLSTGILAQKLDDEVNLRVVRSGSTKFATEMEFLDVSARKMSLVVLPPSRFFKIPTGTGIKVVAGTCSWVDSATHKRETRVMATRPFTSEAMLVNADILQSGDEGVIFMKFSPSKTSGKPPFSNMAQIPSYNIFPSFVPDDVRAMKFPWVKVQDRDWAHGRFKGLEFYNLTGWHLRFEDDSMDEIAHVQMWTAGKGVSAGFHNHVEKSFCEIHGCLVNGTGEGGMRWATVPDAQFDPDQPDLKKTELIVVPDLHAHGPLWRTQKDGYPLIRMNDTVDYPWHAWLAGPWKPDTEQSYDVWVAFEFPSFETYSTPKPPSALAAGTYIVTEPTTEYSVGIKDLDATDGAHVLAYPPPIMKGQRWNVHRVPGTDLYEFSNEVTGSLLCAQWPPVDGQRIIGTHSPANMGMTSRWSVMADEHGKLSLMLPGGEPMLLSAAQMKSVTGDTCPIVLRKGTGAEPPAWRLVPV